MLFMSEAGNDLVFSFPLYYWSHTRRPDNPFAATRGPDGQQTTPFFTSDVAALRFLLSLPDSANHGGSTVPDRAMSLKLLPSPSLHHWYMLVRCGPRCLAQTAGGS